MFVDNMLRGDGPGSDTHVAEPADLGCKIVVNNDFRNFAIDNKAPWMVKVGAETSHIGCSDEISALHVHHTT